MHTGWTFWVDRGGTFTDVIGVAPDGVERSMKLPSVSPAYADATVAAIRHLMSVGDGEPFPGQSVAAIKLGTTVATNALLERTGAKTLFVTSRGFADCLLIADQTRPNLFDLSITRPSPLYAGVIENAARVAADGTIISALDEDDLRRGFDRAISEGFESAAVAFPHGDLYPDHENRAAELANMAGLSFVVTGREVSALPKFIPRAQTAVVDAYLTPGLREYVDSLSAAVAGSSVYFMTSGGGLVRANMFRGRDAILSGPAGGVIAVSRMAKNRGDKPVLGLDMGGTSTDVCRYAGLLERRDQAEVAGVKLRASMLDIETIAAGGGSILTFDGLRARVGPESAGADPGPAAYGRGGPSTITDANLVLGRLDPHAMPLVFGRDGNGPIDVDAARTKLAELADAMGAPSIEAAAEGFLAIAVEQMASAIRQVSTQRGFDPRNHALIAFGGAAGQVACQVADTLGIKEVLSPRYASLMSAWGIGQARTRSARRAGVEVKFDESGLAIIAPLVEQLAYDAANDLIEQGEGDHSFEYRCQLRYAESDSALRVDYADLNTMTASFEEHHRRLFGFIEPEHPIVIESVEVEAIALLPIANTERSHSELNGDQSAGVGAMIEGPGLLLRKDTQIWIPMDWRAVEEADGLVRLTRTRIPVHSAIATNKPDPVTLELFNRRFMCVAEAMGAALERTARSVNIKERLDFSCALFDAAGDLVANAPHMPVHLGSMGASVRAVLAKHSNLAPGTGFALNNPYAGGTHLPDVTVVMPVFTPKRGTPSFFVAARGHHADVGGVQPGSMPPFSSSIDEEGVLFDALPILRGGHFLEEDVLCALTAGPFPARSPSRNIGDLKAQIAACQTGAAAVLALIKDHGDQTVARYMRFVQANAEASVRRAVTRLTNGHAVVPIDGGGKIAVQVSVRPDLGEATLDFTDSSPQLSSNFNAPSSIVSAAALYVFRTLVDDDIPLNGGCLTPLTILVPPGSMLSPSPPAAVVAGNVETSQHIVDALYEALGVMANSQGTMNNFTFGNAEHQYYETICGGVGATRQRDGASAIHSHMTNSRLTDPEILERRFPVLVESFSVRSGSGGAGLRRGGDGVVRRIRFLAPLEAALLSTRREHAAKGLEGGHSGAPGRQRLIRTDGTVKELLGCFSFRVQPGEAIEIETPGAGGFGLPKPNPGQSDTRKN